MPSSTLCASSRLFELIKLMAYSRRSGRRILNSLPGSARQRDRPILLINRPSMDRKILVAVPASLSDPAGQLDHRQNGGRCSADGPHPGGVTPGTPLPHLQCAKDRVVLRAATKPSPA